MRLISALAGGFAGACAMTILHEVVKKIDKDAPHIDLMGMEALSKGVKSVTGHEPDKDNLYGEALAGEIVGNTMYYSLAAIGDEHKDLKGSILGIAGGLGSIYLPGIFGLNKDHSGRTDKTKALTAIYYTVGGLVASQVMDWVEDKLDEREQGSAAHAGQIKNS